jgi:hypothetical protein
MNQDRDAMQQCGIVGPASLMLTACLLTPLPPCRLLTAASESDTVPCFILKTHGGQPPDGCFRLWPRAESADLKVAYVGGASTNFRSLLLICVTERHRDFYPCVSRVWQIASG